MNTLTQKHSAAKEFMRLLDLYRKACAAPDSPKKRDAIVKLSEKLDAHKNHVPKRLWARINKEH